MDLKVAWRVPLTINTADHIAPDRLGIEEVLIIRAHVTKTSCSSNQFIPA